MKKVLLFIFGLTCFNLSSYSQAEYKIYAGFMYHFGKYIQWPTAKSSGDFVIGVVGSSPINSALDALAGSKDINGRKIVIKPVSSSGDLSACNILFIPKSDHGKLSGYTSAGKSNSVLIVTESDGSTSQGSVVNFIQDAGKVRFELSEDGATKNGLKVASELKKLAILK